MTIAAFQDPFPQFTASLKSKRVWCLWRREESNGRPTKIPYQTNRYHARSNDPMTWATFEDVCSAVAGQDEFHLGIFADGSHTFLDLDKCIGPDGTIERWAQAALLRASSYAEVSPSGSGLHIFLAGAVAKASKINGCEIYSTARFFTVTGKHIPSTPLTVNALSADQLEELRDDIAQNQLRPYDCKTREPRTSSGSLVAPKLLSHSERETKLERGLSSDLSEYHGDRSAAVHGVLQLLARKHQGNREAMDEEFCASQLCADWGSKWDRLCENELSKAIGRWQENGEPAWNDVPSTRESGWTLVRYSAIQATEIDWIWKGYLATGKISMLNGEPGHGKSLVSLDIAARISTQSDWPDCQKNVLPPSSVLLLTEEEDASDTIKPRFLAAGGNADKLVSLSMGAGTFRIEADTDRLRKLIERQAPDTKLIILDPVSDYTGVDANKDTDVRPMLNKLKDLACELGIAVLGINHLNKKTDLGAIHRVSGARAWVSFARLNFLLGKTGDGLRHLVPLKTNIAKDNGSLMYTIGDKSITEGRLTISGTPVVFWQGKGEVTAAELTAAPIPAKSQSDEAEAWLREQLKDGEWHLATHVLKEAAERRLNGKKIQRLKDKIGVEKRKVGMPAQVEWRIALSTDREMGGHREDAGAAVFSQEVLAPREDKNFFSPESVGL
jgi:putative DNA primase/helicase